MQNLTHLERKTNVPGINFSDLNLNRFENTDDSLFFGWTATLTSIQSEDGFNDADFFKDHFHNLQVKLNSWNV